MIDARHHEERGVTTYCREPHGTKAGEPDVANAPHVANAPPTRLAASPNASASALDTDDDRSGPTNWVVRAFARSWVLELGVVLALALAYNIIRAIPHGSSLDPYTHARAVLAAEGALFEHLEEPLNHWISTVPVLAVAACYYYAVLHYVATPTVFFLSRRHGGWHYWRGYWALITASGIALVIYALYPVAPPRLMPGIPINDIMREFSEYGWWGSAASAPRGIGDATNQFAAMPSMHFGWALWCGMQMWGFGSRAWRSLAVLYPTLLALVVLATGNHFLLDVLGGAACVVLGYLIVNLLGRLVSTRRPGVQTAAAAPA
jgi:hypothetical protein